MTNGKPRRRSVFSGLLLMAAFAPLVVLTILFGVYPKPVLDMSQAAVAVLVDNYHHAIGAAKTAALAR